ncbi:tyrosine-type recombinase/integrase [Sphingomonas zeae]
MNVTEALHVWRSYREQMVRLHLVAESTYENQAAIVLQLQRALGHHQLDGLRKSHIELWMGERLQTCAPVTVRGEMNVLRQVLNWCVDEGHLLAKPRFPTLSVANVEADLPSDEAFLWVLAHVPEQHSRALEFMMLTGLSPHELERLQVRDESGTMFLETGRSTISIGMRPDFPVKQESRRRPVPLNRRAADIWYQAASGREPTAAVFPSVAAMQKAIRRAVDNPPDIPFSPTGTDRVTPKLMRKWFASKVASQQPEHILQRLMGHAPGSPITRRHYVRSSEGQGRDAVASVTI